MANAPELPPVSTDGLHSSEDHCCGERAHVQPPTECARLNDPEQPVRLASRTAYVPRPDAHAVAKYENGPPESVGKILLTCRGKLGALSPRDGAERREHLGVHDSEEAAQRALQEHRRARLAKAVGYAGEKKETG